LEEKMEKRDISKQAIVVLVFLAILVSVLGTFTVLNQVDNSNTGSSNAGTRIGSTSNAKMAITIVSKQEDSSIAKASINIQKNA